MAFFLEGTEITAGPLPRLLDDVHAAREFHRSTFSQACAFSWPEHQIITKASTIPGLIDLGAPIVPGKSAAGVFPGSAVSKLLSTVGAHSTTKLSSGEIHHLGLVEVREDGVITRVGVYSGHRGLQPGIQVGSTISEVEESFGGREEARDLTEVLGGPRARWRVQWKCITRAILLRAEVAIPIEHVLSHRSGAGHVFMPLSCAPGGWCGRGKAARTWARCPRTSFCNAQASLP